MTRPRATPPDTERLIASARRVARVAHRPWSDADAKQAAADAALWLAKVAWIYRAFRLKRDRVLAEGWFARASRGR